MSCCKTGYAKGTALIFVWLMLFASGQKPKLTANSRFSDWNNMIKAVIFGIDDTLIAWVNPT